MNQVNKLDIGQADKDLEISKGIDNHEAYEIVKAEMRLQTDEKQPVILCDVDGTVALMNGKRSPFAYDKADHDEPNVKVIETVLAMKEYYSQESYCYPYDECKLIFLSAREDVLFNVDKLPEIDQWNNKNKHNYTNKLYSSAAELTREWLNKYIGEDNYSHLIMRDRGDYRCDRYVKYDIYKDDIEHMYNVLMVFDDRDRVVDMWRNGLKLHCFQVADGNF